MSNKDEIFRRFGTRWFTAREYSPDEHDEVVLQNLVQQGFLEWTVQNTLEITRQGQKLLYEQVVYRVRVDTANGYDD